MSEKIKVPVCIAAAILILTGAFYVSHRDDNRNCVSYYDKTGSDLLYKTCD